MGAGGYFTAADLVEKLQSAIEKYGDHPLYIEVSKPNWNYNEDNSISAEVDDAKIEFDDSNIVLGFVEEL